MGDVYLVLKTATVREGIEQASQKLGELKKGEMCMNADIDKTYTDSNRRTLINIGPYNGKRTAYVKLNTGGENNY